MEIKDSTLRIALVQYDVAWEDKTINLAYIHQQIAMHKEDADLFILPEMCTTGFSNDAHSLAEDTDGITITSLKYWAEKYDVAICGSYIYSAENKFYNRGFFITPSSEYYYDKRHLFRMGKEGEVYTAGNTELIVTFKDFRINLQVCYDLRFPVWARNVDNKYDLIIYVASWPKPRVKVWDTLLQARAIENMSYVCGVNRVGIDGNKLEYNGHSSMVDAKGDLVAQAEDNQETTVIATISKSELTKFREKFPVWKDADNFRII